MNTTITPWGQATVEILSDGFSLLTDPVLSQRIFWLKRLLPLPVDPATIKQPDAILISHAHYDHLDLPSFKYLKNNIPIILPKGLSSLLKKFVQNPLIELSHGATHTLGPDVKVTAFPVTHHGFRINPLRFNVCNGYLIKIHGKTIFFPGDTAYRNDFKTVTKDPIDVALLPISCYQPEWFMKRRHINPAEALQIFTDLNARQMIPIHWGTFKLSTESIHEPIEWLQRSVQERDLTKRVCLLQPGQSLEI